MYKGQGKKRQSQREDGRFYGSKVSRTGLIPGLDRQIGDRDSFMFNLAPGIEWGSTAPLELCCSFQHSTVFSAYPETGASCVTSRPRLSGRGPNSTSGIE